MLMARTLLFWVANNIDVNHHHKLKLNVIFAAVYNLLIARRLYWHVMTAVDEFML
jgi:hypothetical protein